MHNFRSTVKQSKFEVNQNQQYDATIRSQKTKQLRLQLNKQQITLMYMRYTASVGNRDTMYVCGHVKLSTMKRH